MGFSSNIDQFVSDLTRMQKATSPERVAAIVRGKVIRLFKRVVQETPQWSGVAASLWSINATSSPKPSGYMVTDASEAKSKGDSAAVSTAFAGSAWFNSASMDTLGFGLSLENPQPYVGQLEAGTKLRDVNRPGKMVYRAIAAESGIETIGWAKMSYEMEKL